jgi:voltage-gated potassium channel
VESVKIAEQALVALDFKYSKQILVALLPMGLTVILHGAGIELVHRFFRRFGRPVMRGPHREARTAVIICVVGILLVAHFGGVAVWATFYYLNDLIKDMTHAMDYSFNSYTTMGASGIDLPKGWVGFGNFESMTGMLMFGWSTAVLADIIGKLHNSDD